MCSVWGTWQVQVCVGSSFAVFSEANLAGTNLCRVFAWCVLCGELGRCKFVSGLRLSCFLERNWQVQICVVGSSLGVFCVGNLAGANLCRVFVWGVFWGEIGRCKFV